jgi:hypothetical protein
MAVLFKAFQSKVNDLWKSSTCDFNPNDNSIVLCIKTPSLELSKLLDPADWPKLVQANPQLLNQPPDHCQLVAKILQTLTHDEAVRAFLNVSQYPTRRGVMECLEEKFKAQLDDKLTQHALQLDQKIRKGPNSEDESILFATKEFVQSLDASEQTCCSKECVGEPNMAFKPYTHFRLASCQQHSLHLGCTDKHDCEGVHREKASTKRLLKRKHSLS